MKGENFQLKKNLNEDIEFLKTMNQKQELISSSLNEFLTLNSGKNKPSHQKLINLEEITNLIKVRKLKKIKIYYYLLIN